MADDTPAEIIKTKIIKIHKKSPTNTYPADDKKRKKPRETALAAASRVDDNLTVTVFRVGCTSHLARACFNTVGQPVAQTDSDWDGGEKKALMKRTLRSRPPLSHLAYTRQASIWSIKLSSCRWVSRLQQSINGKKKNTFFYSSLPYCCSLLHLHVKPIAE